jgi:hypothetical protein
MKRYRAPKTKPGQLRVYYGRADGDLPDVCFAWGGGGANKCDSNLLHYALASKRLELVYGDEAKKLGVPWRFGPSLIEELTARGYDISTLKFSIELKQPPQRT